MHIKFCEESPKARYPSEDLGLGGKLEWIFDK